MIYHRCTLVNEFLITIVFYRFILVEFISVNIIYDIYNYILLNNMTFSYSLHRKKPYKISCLCFHHSRVTLMAKRCVNCSNYYLIIMMQKQKNQVRNPQYDLRYLQKRRYHQWVGFRGKVQPYIIISKIVNQPADNIEFIQTLYQGLSPEVFPLWFGIRFDQSSSTTDVLLSNSTRASSFPYLTRSG